VRYVKRTPIGESHGFQSCLGAGGLAQVIAVKMERMWQTQFLVHIDQGVDYVPGSDLVAVDFIVQPAHIATPSPVHSPARVHRLDAIASRRSQQEHDIVCKSFPVARVDQAEHEVVVAHKEQHTRI
jgi:hypothetical protein